MEKVDRRIVAASVNTAAVIIYTAIHILQRAALRYNTGLTEKEVKHVLITAEQLKESVRRLGVIEKRCKG